MKEIHIRVGLFAAALLAMLVGYHVLFLHHAPEVFSNVQEDMSHGWCVPVFSLYLVWHERRKIVESVGEPSLVGLLLLVPFAFAGFLGVRGAQVRLEIVGFVGTLIGLVWTVFGARTMRQTLFPSLYLLFCLPFHTYLDVITIHFRMLSVAIANAIFQVCHVDVVREGTMLLSPTGSFSIDVAEPCSGMRSLFAMMALTAGYAYFTQPTWGRRGLLFVCSIPIAVIGNVSRILSIVLIAATCSPDFATGFCHDYSGYVVFGVAVFLMVAADGLITKGMEQCARS